MPSEDTENRRRHSNTATLNIFKKEQKDAATAFVHPQTIEL
jgi:hypothetical protein